VTQPEPTAVLPQPSESGPNRWSPPKSKLRHLAQLKKPLAALAKFSGLFRPSHQHSASSATILLSLSSLVSGILGLVRSMYIAHVFGARHVTDAYNAAFNLPDMINYFLVGGVASITLVSILNRHREAGDEAGADRALSVVLLGMLAVLGVGILLAEIFAPFYTRVFFPKLDVETAALCTRLTRILLPAQLFFFAGGVLGSRLLVRKIFLYQAITPIIYNLGIIFGGVLLSHRFGIESLAFGVLAGSFVGSAVLNSAGAFRSGLRFYPIFNLRHPAFVEWLRLSLPLMIGVSLAMADKWILSYFATADAGGLTRLTNAKALFNAPLVVVGAAAGAASLPFFSSLFAQGKLFEFNTAVCRSVSRLISVALLLTGWMVALANPLVDLYRGGVYTQTDALSTARYFALFSLTLALWASQGIYARAFYAARNTMTPAISGTVVTLASIPVYAILAAHFGVEGLAVASDIGILMHTLALALLLHRFRLVSLATLDWRELARSALAAWVAFTGVSTLLRLAPAHATHALDFAIILGGTAVWAALGYATLQMTDSKLIDQIRRRA
jgi:putative peptidoglycan lipid II flippase